MLLHDLRHLGRSLARSPAFALSALATLGLGIGVTTAIFAVFYGVLLRPLPFPEPGRLAFITRDGDVSVPDGADWRAQSTTFESIALFGRDWSLDLTGLGDPEPVRAYAVEPAFFRVLGVEPLLGRLFTDQDNQPGGAHSILISEGFWRTRFGADRHVVGRQLVLSGDPTTVIGVLPREFDFLDTGAIGAVPLAVAMPWAPGSRGTNNLDAIGRVRSGVAFAAARAELTAISTRLAEEYPQTNRGKIVDPLPLTEFLVGGSRTGLWLVLAAVATLLVIATVNLAGLLLARVTARHRELSVRAALGAGRRRLAGQLVVEGLALAALGGALGLGVAGLGLGALRHLLPEGMPRTTTLAFRGPVLLFGLAMAFGSGLLCGVLPATRALRVRALEGLGTTRAGGERGRHRALRLVVATEIGLAVALLAAAGVLAKSFQRLWSQPLGFEPRGTLSANLVLPASRYGTMAAQTAAYTGIVDRLRALPGVTDAAYAISLPLVPGGAVGNKVLFENRSDLTPDQPSGARIRPVYGDYFATLRLPILRGRAFLDTDRADAPPVAIINQTMARLFWGDRDPIGARIALRDWHELTPGPVWMTIVGVAEDVRSLTLADGDQAAVYMPYVQRQVSWQRFGNLVIRTTSAPGGFGPALKEAVWSVDPLLAVSRIESLEARHATSAARERFLAVVVGLFAGSALLLVVQGLWGVVAYAVAERRREIGVRVALGALAGDVVRLVVREALAPLAAGALLGLGLAVIGGRLVRGALFEVSPTDPLVLVGTVGVLLVVALAASAIPARRATRIDPLEAMRAE